MALKWRVLDRQAVRSLDEYVDGGGGHALRVARKSEPDEIVEIVAASGLRGRGGAGFPTGTKWKTVRAARSHSEVTTIVVNAAEGEPGTFKDRALLRTNPYRVIEGALVAAAAMESDRIRIGIKATFEREIDRLNRAIDEIRAAGWIDDIDLALVLGPSSYLFGEETGLLEVVEGRQPFPRVTPPYRRGVQEHDTRSAGGVTLAVPGGDESPPALVDNVETLANVALIVDRGVDWFRELGTEDSPGTIICTVTGATARSAVGEVEMGTTLREVIDLVGWGPRRNHQVAVVLSGTANPLIPASLLDTPLTYEDMRAAGTGLGSAGFIVFDDTTDPAAVVAGVSRFLSVESCGQCEPCKTDGLAIARQLNESLTRDLSDDETAALRRRLDTVAIGARCNLARQQADVVGSLLSLFEASVDSKVGAPNRRTEPVTIAPIADLGEGWVTLDSRQSTKQPDWSHNEIDSGAAPAARLGNTPVHIEVRRSSRRWGDWSADASGGSPLEMVEDAHDSIEALISHVSDLAAGSERDRSLDDLVVAVRTHVDVAKRVLFPMVRRVGDDEGEALADAAEAQANSLVRLVDDVNRADPSRDLDSLTAALHEHAALGAELVDLLRAHLDPEQQADLGEHLADARATSTVARLYRNASARPVPAQPRRQPPAPMAERAPAPPQAPVSPQAPVRPRPEAVPAPVTQQDPKVERRPDRPSAPVEMSQPSQRSADPSLSQASDSGPAGVKRVLVGVDGSSPAAAALAWSTRLAQAARAEVVAANVFEPQQAEISPEEYEDLLARSEQRLRGDWAGELSNSSVEHRWLQLDGAPDVLLDAARTTDSDLLVVGTRGAARHAGFHLGSLAHHLAHHTTGPLAIVARSGASLPLDHLIVGVDGSPGSDAAVRWTAGMASAIGARVTAVCAFDPNRKWGLDADPASWRATAERAVSDASIEPLRQAGVPVGVRIVENQHPLGALEAVAAEEGAGVIVVGARALSSVGGTRLGRLPLQLVHHTHIPVVLVPPASAN